MEQSGVDVVLRIIEERNILPPHQWLTLSHKQGVGTENFIIAVRQLENVGIVGRHSMVNADNSGVSCYVLEKNGYTPKVQRR